MRKSAQYSYLRYTQVDQIRPRAQEACRGSLHRRRWILSLIARPRTLQRPCKSYALSPWAGSTAQVQDSCMLRFIIRQVDVSEALCCSWYPKACLFNKTANASRQVPFRSWQPLISRPIKCLIPFHVSLNYRSSFQSYNGLYNHLFWLPADRGVVFWVNQARVRFPAQ